MDVFVDSFRLCHELSLKKRLNLDPEAISVADLLPTKLQVARLNEKDVSDAAALLLDDGRVFRVSPRSLSQPEDRACQRSPRLPLGRLHDNFGGGRSGGRPPVASRLYGSRAT